MAYGAATWGSHGKGRLAAPNKAVMASAAERFDVVLQDEYMTSQTCDLCGCQVTPVWRRVDPLDLPTPFHTPVPTILSFRRLEDPLLCQEVRGLRFCPKCCKLRARDPMAACNIGKAFFCKATGIDPPELMQRRRDR